MEQADNANFAIDVLKLEVHKELLCKIRGNLVVLILTFEIWVLFFWNLSAGHCSPVKPNCSCTTKVKCQMADGHQAEVLGILLEVFS